MLQDEQFTNDIKQLIQAKQKQSAFVYVRNHLHLIEQALNEGAKISDIYDLLKKNSIRITLPTLRLYLYRLRNSNKKIAKNKNDDKIQKLNNIDIEPNFIKSQTPNLEELSKAFQNKNK